MKQQLDTKLIENALALTGKKLYEMNRWYSWEYEVEYKFCIAEFCYYLLSPEFIEKYQNLQIVKWCIHYYVGEFWKAIHDYQAWNETPLIELLSKIWN